MRGTQRVIASCIRSVRIIPADAGNTEQLHLATPGLGDHPRGCGEHSDPISACSMPRGSSPRMRGAQLSDRQDDAGRGIIPADAGSTSLIYPAYIVFGDHPRGCGEHPDTSQRMTAKRGSSPRMRGAPLGGYRGYCSPGIIPADAGSTFRRQRPIAVVKDHPRGCGEHWRIPLSWLLIRGSSPRMRGAQCKSKGLDVISRIIPADAGSTADSAHTTRHDRDHPRGCGEHIAGSINPMLQYGSSPRMRGAHRQPMPLLAGMRIIPADAGSTEPNPLVERLFRDHPRGCGEHRLRVEDMTGRKGSSPRMRGAQGLRTLSRHGLRIIPADAGSTLCVARGPGDIGDHPRGCGEHGDEGMGFPRVQGSSPRMRGAPCPERNGEQPAGIIPADAGSTPSFSWDLSISEDHPRGCGEHRALLWASFEHLGSSPRMRGALMIAARSIVLIRIIPADAGSTSPGLRCARRRWDHPRGCGEHALCFCRQLVQQGSSPRMRGAPVIVIYACIGGGIIPADAGSTC